MKNLAAGGHESPLLDRMRAELTRLMSEAHDEFLPGTAYAAWCDEERSIVRTALGPVRRPPQSR